VGNRGPTERFFSPTTGRGRWDAPIYGGREGRGARPLSRKGVKDKESEGGRCKTLKAQPPMEKSNISIFYRNQTSGTRDEGKYRVTLRRKKAVPQTA